MRKCLSFILAVVLVCSTIWIGSGTDAVHVDAAESAIVKNGGFEELTIENYPAQESGWQTIGTGYEYYGSSSTQSTYIAVVENVGRNGTKAMRVYSSKDSATGEKLDIVQRKIYSLKEGKNTL